MKEKCKKLYYNNLFETNKAHAKRFGKELMIFIKTKEK